MFKFLILLFILIAAWCLGLAWAMAFMLVTYVVLSLLGYEKWFMRYQHDC